jgi:transposase-like protein
MRKTKKDKSVLEKVDAVLALHRAQNPGTPLSISSLAQQAGVSRANLYVTHSKLVQELQGVRRQNTLNELELQKSQLKKMRDENVELKRVNKALLFFNVELRQEITRLQRRLNKSDTTRKNLNPLSANRI